ncbi:MAG TPA: AcvB/VirJ family lysyl-phosphatidylglycerol hydrolase [Candidatus Polarisedimenticolia bacterium]|jgi:type IV secretory pathway VirJ component
MTWLLLAAAVVAASAASSASKGFVEEAVALPLFGRTSIYRPEPIERTRGVILFVSGDGGWNLGVVDMARRSAARAIVVGVPMPAWRKLAEKHPDRCWYPAGELESLAQAVEKIYKLPRYLKPILVGYSSGATVVYGALAQAPAESFDGALSLGFCPDLELARPFCPRSAWKPSYDPRKRMSLLPVRPDLAARAGGGARWTALAGEVDQVCDLAAVGRFLAAIPAAHLVPLPKVGHGFSVPRNWGAAYDAAIETMLEPVTAWDALPDEGRHVVPNRSPEEVRARMEALDLPLEIQWPDGARDVLIFVSGDGGWAELDQEVAAALAARGVAVVGFNSLRYFWSAKTPEGFAADLARLIEALPEGTRIFAGGYSFGAEVVPAAVSRLPSLSAGVASSLSRIEGLVLLGPARYATFEVSPLDWIRAGGGPTDYPVKEAIRSVRTTAVLCLDSSPPEESGCPDGPAPGLTRATVPGGHHFAGDSEGLAVRIISFIRKSVAGREEKE